MPALTLETAQTMLEIGGAVCAALLFGWRLTHSVARQGEQNAADIADLRQQLGDLRTDLTTRVTDVHQALTAEIGKLNTTLERMNTRLDADQRLAAAKDTETARAISAVSSKLDLFISLQPPRRTP